MGSSRLLSISACLTVNPWLSRRAHLRHQAHCRAQHLITLSVYGAYGDTPGRVQALQHIRFASGVVGRSRAVAFFACSSRQTPSRVTSNRRLDRWYISLIEPNPTSIHVPSLLRPELLLFFFALSLIIAGGAGWDDGSGGRMGKVHRSTWHPPRP